MRHKRISKKKPKNLLFAMFDFLWSIVLLFGGLMLFSIVPSNAMDALHKYQSRQWLTTVGRIESVKAYMPDDDKGSRLIQSYSYVVGNKRYGRSLEDKPSNPSDYLLSAQKARWESYLKGECFKVFYDPKNPEKSLLDHEQSSSFLSAIGLSFVFVLSGAMLTCAAIDRFRDMGVK